MADESKSTGHMERTLQTRHLSMIALGGTIGTGLDPLFQLRDLAER